MQHIEKTEQEIKYLIENRTLKMNMYSELYIKLIYHKRYKTQDSVKTAIENNMTMTEISIIFELVLKHQREHYQPANDRANRIRTERFGELLLDTTGYAQNGVIDNMKSKIVFSGLDGNRILDGAVRILVTKDIGKNIILTNS
jgi:hypothetical protein